MRIWFRGKTCVEGKWVHGFYSIAGFDSVIIDENGVVDEVDLETVGQLIGMRDKNGVEIYKRDILSWEDYTTPPHKGLWYVEWNAYCWDLIRLFAPRFNGDKSIGCFEGKHFLWKSHRDMVIVGNTHDNPELLEKTEND